ncbi:uncharacterized protein DS421_18g611610 [Arachis hypogaea]|nr:uncharacterized protein DS421_18g611610 [Arachis hypogaea]
MQVWKSRRHPPTGSPCVHNSRWYAMSCKVMVHYPMASGKCGSSDASAPRMQ